ncbi:hypothetical protein C27AD_08751 [Salinisphaera hydrothermalis C27AD]
MTLMADLHSTRPGLCAVVFLNFVRPKKLSADRHRFTQMRFGFRGIAASRRQAEAEFTVTPDSKAVLGNKVAKTIRATIKAGSPASTAICVHRCRSADQCLTERREQSCGASKPRMS